MALPVLPLDKRTAAAVHRGHPWLWPDVLAAAPRALRAGDEVSLVDGAGATMGRALVDGGGGPALRIWSRDPADPPLPRLLRERLRAARRLREAVVPERTDAFRLVHGEGDRLPGLVIDRYGHVLVLRLDGKLWDPHLQSVTEAIRDEGGQGWSTLVLAQRGGEARTLLGEPVVDLIVSEQGRRFRVRPGHGQKTGFFLDQRPNRHHVEGIARGAKRALNLFSFTGGFSIALARGGAAHVRSVDLSESILEDCRAQFPLNGLDPSGHDFLATDAFRWLPTRDDTAPYDLVVVDPPSLAHRQEDVKAARDASFRLHKALVRRLARPAIVVTASCTARLSPEEVLNDAIAGLRAGGRPADRVLREGGAGEDHPVVPGFPEGRYLHCATLWVP